jgi:hypothetical protein
VTANASELVEVVARLGDTILELVLVEAGSTVRLGETALVAVPGTHRVGLVDVTISRVMRPVRGLPYATNGDRRTLPYLAMSLAVHVVICGIAITTPLGGGTEVGFTDRVGAPRIGWRTGAGAADAAAATPTRVGMALEEIGPNEPRRDPDRAIATAAAQMPGTTDNDNNARARIAALVTAMDASSSYDLIDTNGGGGGGGGGGGEGGGFGGSRDGSTGTGGGLVGSDRQGNNIWGSGIGDAWIGAGQIGGMRARVSGVPTVILCGGPAPCVVTGDLDKAMIRRYIRRVIPKIQYCYEKRLLVDARLAGVVATEFLIDADGKVAEATTEGVHEDVAGCVADVIRTIEFPRSATRTSTRVSYPFTFRTP